LKDVHNLQFDVQDYLNEHDASRRSAVSFMEYVNELRSERSKRPSTGLKGVNERGSKFEARNTPFPVRGHAPEALLSAAQRCVFGMYGM
jgi:hypothetical protein